MRDSIMPREGGWVYFSMGLKEKAIPGNKLQAKDYCSTQERAET